MSLRKTKRSDEKEGFANCWAWGDTPFDMVREALEKGAVKSVSQLLFPDGKDGQLTSKHPLQEILECLHKARFGENHGFVQLLNVGLNDEWKQRILELDDDKKFYLTFNPGKAKGVAKQWAYRLAFWLDLEIDIEPHELP